MVQVFILHYQQTFAQIGGIALDATLFQTDVPEKRGGRGPEGAQS